MEYAKNWDFATISCSGDQSENAILASLIHQLASKSKIRARSTGPILKSFDDSICGAKLSNHLWRLLETMVKGAPDCETVFLLDDIDRLENDTRPTFIRKLLELEENATASGAVIRVLVSSRSFSNIQETLGRFKHIRPNKERLGEVLSLKL